LTADGARAQLIGMPTEDSKQALTSATLDWDAAWQPQPPMRCACGSSLELFAQRCPSCRAKNPVARLRKRRARIERWLARRSEAELLPSLGRSDLLPEIIARYETMLAEVIRRPLPERQKDEALTRYLKRVVDFFPSMFKTTSPANQARAVHDRLGRSAQAITVQATEGAGRVIGQATGTAPKRTNPEAIAAQSERAQGDLAQIMTGYMEGLKALKLYHDRMVSAWAPVRPLLKRPLPEGKLREAWARVRDLINPVGRLLRFGTAIWTEPGEKEQIQRFEAEILRFHEQIERFNTQAKGVESKRAQLVQSWRLSLHKHLVAQLVGHLSVTPTDRRATLVDYLRAQRGIGSWWWRWLFGKRTRRNS
jgi:hypothetical protein